MKNFLIHTFPGLYEWYSFNRIKQIEQKQSAYYKNLSREAYEQEIVRLYRDKTGHDIDLKAPKRYTEKIQWTKLYGITPLISKLSDKYEVREWVAERIGQEYLVPLLGVWDTFDEIDFDALPDSFVLKTNNASATNIIVNNKSDMNKKRMKQKLDYWMERPFGLLSGLELQYMAIKPRIIAEKNLMSGGLTDLPDYKFFCFDGKVFCSYTMVDYTFNHHNGRLGFFDRDYKLMDAYRADYTRISEQIPRPKNYDKMVEIAEILSKGFSHVRVDFYNIDGKIYFGEMTFTTNSGYTQFVPDEFDYELGDQWRLPVSE